MPTLKMTAKAIDSIKPTLGKQVDYFDSNTGGLVLRVSPKGTKTWAYVYRAQTLNGRKLRRYSLGRYPGLSLVQARGLASEQYRAILMEGADPASDRGKSIEVMTMRDLATAYIDRHAKPNKKSWKVDARNLEKNVLPFIGKLHPKEVERHHIEDILDRIANRGATVLQNRVFALLSSMFNWAAGVYIDIPPTYGMKKRLKEKPRERCLSSEEIKLLWNTLSSEQLGKSGRRLYVSDPVSIVLKLLLVTAQRSSEVSQAKVSEFDLVHRVWTIPAGRAKNGRSHRVPLSDMALELIKVAHSTNNGSEFLFPSKVSTLTSEVGERPIISTAANHALRKVLKSVSLSNITPHDFRETAATGMMYLGVPEQNVASVLNHARTSVTAKHYARHSFEAEKREALKKWAVHLAEIIEA